MGTGAFSSIAPLLLSGGKFKNPPPPFPSLPRAMGIGVQNYTVPPTQLERIGVPHSSALLPFVYLWSEIPI